MEGVGERGEGGRERERERERGARERDGESAKIRYEMRTVLLLFSLLIKRDPNYSSFNLCITYVRM